ncbi:MAG: hypothetical protein U1F36_17945 [Planctomycetota bacterium]
MSRAHAVLVAGLCIAMLPAQVQRERRLGLVRRADGSAWDGARVEFRSALPDPKTWPLDVDTVVATSDERGRFAVEILRGRSYVAWASASPRDTGPTTFSTVVEVDASPVIELRGLRDPIAATRLSFGELASKARVLRVLVPGAAWCEELAIVDGHTVVPALPSGEADIEIVDGAGHLLARGRLHLDGAEHVVESASSGMRRGRVIDSEEGEPVSGAAVGCVNLGRIVPVAFSGADGTVRLDLGCLGLRVDGFDRPQRAPDEGDWFTVLHPDHELGVLPFDEDDAVPRDDDRVSAECGLLPHGDARDLRLLFDGVPLRDGMFAGHGLAQSRIGDSGTIGMDFDLSIRLDADGVMSPHHVDRGEASRWRMSGHLFLSADAAAALPPAWASTLGEGQLLEFGQGGLLPDAAGGDGKPDEYDLARQFRLVEFEFLSAKHGGPVAGVTLFSGEQARLLQAPHRSDAGGVARTLVPMTTDDPVYALLCCEDGWFAVQIQRHRLPRRGTTAAHLRVQLQPVAIFDVEVRDVDGSGVDRALDVAIRSMKPMTTDAVPGDAIDDEGVFTTCSSEMVFTLLRSVNLHLVPARSHLRIPLPALQHALTISVHDLGADTAGGFEVDGAIEPKVYTGSVDLRR